jgi:RsiW-degrading membrane proteinase PrsW (M82 family)
MDQRICINCGTRFSIEYTSCPRCGYVFPAFVEKLTKKPHTLSHYAAICISLGLAAGIFAGIAEAMFVLPMSLPLTEQPTDLTFLLIAVVLAPIVEEPMKLLGSYVIIYSEKTKFKLQWWILFGLFGGLGFALLENTLYFAVTEMSYGASAGGTVFLARMMLSLPFHLIASSVAGCGFGLYVHTKKLRYFVAFLAIAIAIHALFNLAASFA